MLWPIIISSFIIGVFLWLLGRGMIKDSEVLCTVSVVLIIGVALLGLVMAGGLATIRTKTIDITYFELYKGKAIVVLIVGNNVYTSYTSKMYNLVSEKSKVQIKQGYNSYGGYTRNALLVDEIPFQ